MTQLFGNRPPLRPDAPINGSFKVASLAFFVLSVTLYAAFAMNFPVDPLFSVINYAIAISALSWIFVLDRSPTSLRQIFFLCCFIFYAIAPRIEYSGEVVYWLGSGTVFDFYEIAGLLALIGMWSFALAFTLGARSRIVLGRRPNTVRKAPLISGPRLLLLSLLAVVLIYYVNGFSLVNVFFRVTADSGAIQLPSQYLLIYNVTIRSLPSVCLIIYMLFGPRRVLVALALLVLMLIGNPITGFARWQGAMLYMAAFLAAFRPLIRTPHFVTGTLFVGIFLIFPLLNAFRRYSEDLNLHLSLDWIYVGHLDSYQNFARVIEFDTVTFGHQLLGVFLFFVPRELWPGKPVASGMEMAGISQLGFDTIGMNILGEGYINFGVPGVILFAFSFGFFCGQLDRAYWKGVGYSNSFQAFYLLFLGGAVFVFRGSLMSAFAFMVGAYVAILLVLKITDLSQYRFRLGGRSR